MHRFASLLNLSAVTLLAGCVSVQEIQLAPSAGEGLRGREVTIAVRERPDFVAFTPGRAAIGGLIGGAMAIELGNRMVADHNVEDPSLAVMQTVGAELAQRYSLRLAADPARIDSDEVAQIAKSHPRADLLLDVRTIGWGYFYFPTAWNRFRVQYSARLRLIDVKRSAVVAEGGCARTAPEDSANAPTGEELLADGAQRLKSELRLGAEFCLQHFRTATFAFAGPAPALAGAAAPATGAAPPSAAARVETVFWESIRNSSEPSDFRTYLEQYPAGMYSAPARERLAALTGIPRSQTTLPQPGDSWTYRLSEPRRRDGPKQRNYFVKVAAASPAEIVDRYALDDGPSGEWTHKGERQLVTLGKSLFNPYLLQLGAVPQGSLGALEVLDCTGEYLCQATARVAAKERIRVPAGVFDAVKVEIEQSWRATSRGATIGAQMQGGRILTVWYSSEAKRAVKFSSRATHGAVPPIDTDFDLELTSFQLQ